MNIRRALVVAGAVGVMGVGLVAYRYNRSAPVRWPDAQGTSKPGSPNLQPCEAAGQPAECGSLDVFEDRSARRGREIAIKFVVLRALKAAAEPPIFWLEGGPGGAATSAVGPVSQQYFRSLRDSRDLVFIDQRGTGGSNPLKCGDIGETPENLDEFFGPLFPSRLIRACREQLEKQADLRHYATQVAMADMDDVRAALGYERISLAGASYGTISAQVYMRLFPTRVHAAFMAGVATPAFKLPLPFARASQKAFELTAADCAADEACNKAFPDLPAKLSRILARFDRGPITVQMADPATGHDRAVTLARESFVERLRGMLYSTYGGRVVPLVIQRVSEGDFKTFQTMAARFRPGGGGGFRGAYFSVTCSETVPFITEAEIAAETPDTFLGDRRTRAHIEACREWVKGDVAPSFVQPVKSNVPVFMLSGILDGATPPWIALEAIANFPNGRLVQMPKAGHEIPGPCTWNLAQSFFRTLNARDLDIACVAEIRRQPFMF